MAMSTNLRLVSQIFQPLPALKCTLYRWQVSKKVLRCLQLVDNCLVCRIGVVIAKVEAFTFGNWDVRVALGQMGGGGTIKVG